MDLKKYMAVFASEAEELLQAMNTSLLELEKNPDGTETINQLFRCAHSIKGMAATMGFTKTAELAHSMESLMDGFRSGRAKPAAGTFSLLFECADTLERSIKSVSAGGAEADTEGLASRMAAETAKQTAGEKAQSTVQPEKTPGSGEKGREEKVPAPAGEKARSGADSKKTPAKKMSAGKAGSKGQAEKTPAPTAVKTSGGNQAEETAAGADGEKEAAEKTAASITGEKGQAETTSPPEAAGPAHTFSITVTLREGCQMKPLKFELVKARLSKIGIICGEEKKSEQSTEYVLATDEGMKKAEAEAESVTEVKKAEVRIYSGPEIKKKAGPAPEKAEQQTHIKVPVQRLDSLVNLAGELTTAKIRILQLIPENSPALREAAAALERLASDIQNEVMLARMVPAEQIFGKFPRMVRDIAKAEGKEISLAIEGGEIELDRSVLDRIGEPLLHLLRNAADHGIETPEERAKQGKQRAGSVKLSARREKDSVVIEVSDDGRGLDIEEIKRTALEKKVADKGEISKMGEKDVPWLMFRPGFSTSKKVTDISGRGVGLNIVKTATENMGGTIDIESEKGKGCRFTLRLPVSLAIVPSLIVGSGGEAYAIPLSCVQYVHQARKSEIRTIQNRRTIILEGEAVPIIGLHEALNTGGGEEDTILVIKKGREKAGLAVERIIGEQDLMIKPLEQAGGFSGASILPDGKVVLVPDVYGLI